MEHIDFNEEYNRILAQFNVLASNTADRAALTICEVLMNLSEEERMEALRHMEPNSLKRIFMVAYDHEYFEVCKPVMERLEELSAL